MGAVREFYNRTPGGRLTNKRMESLGVLLEVGFEYDAEAKLQYMGRSAYLRFREML